MSRRQLIFRLFAFAWGIISPINVIVSANVDSIDVPKSWKDPFMSLFDSITSGDIPPGWADPYKIEEDTVALTDIPDAWLDPYVRDSIFPNPGNPGTWEDPYAIKTLTYTVCDSTCNFWGKTFRVPGVYREHIVSGTGYEIVVYLDFKYRDKYLFEHEVIIEDGESYEWRSRILKEAGYYYDSLRTAMGCDSIYQLHLEVQTNHCKIPVSFVPIQAKTKLRP